MKTVSVEDVREDTSSLIPAHSFTRSPPRWAQPAPAESQSAQRFWSQKCTLRGAVELWEGVSWEGVSLGSFLGAAADEDPTSLTWRLTWGNPRSTEMLRSPRRGIQRGRVTVQCSRQKYVEGGSLTRLLLRVIE